MGKYKAAAIKVAKVVGTILIVVSIYRTIENGKLTIAGVGEIG